MLYSESGVNIDANNALKRTFGRLARTTFGPAVLSDIGLFGSLFELRGFKEPLLVASCDGVGTKLTVARLVGRHDTVGADLVNHCVNDILTLGAKPLFFLDYLAFSKVKPEVLTDVVKGLARACRNHQCSLVGGETASMPGLYRPGDYDLVGFIVGAVERGGTIDASRVAPGDRLIGLPSAGLHTNGFSLARKVLFGRARLSVKSKVRGLALPLGEELLRPHRSYFNAVYPVRGLVHAVCHITGGGFRENIERLLPFETSCVIHTDSWRPGRLFRLIQELGDVPDEEMYRTFNMGIGMALIVPQKNVRTVMARIKGARLIGRVVRGTFGVAVI